MSRGPGLRPRERRPPRSVVARNATSGMSAEEQQRFAAFKVQKHKQFYKVGADDSDVTDIDSEEEAQSERERLDDQLRQHSGETGMTVDESIKVFHDATADIRKLASVVDTQKRLRLGGLEKVMARTTVMAMTGSSILTSMRAKRYREEIYRGSGLQSVKGKPYKPFEIGVGFQESSQECEKQLRAIFEHRNAFKNPEPAPTTPMEEIGLTDHLLRSAERYERKIFFLDISKYPKSQIRGKSLEITLESTQGDPDLYMAIAEPPTEKEYTWRSVREGSDVILIHPQDPNYIIGIYYIGVSCPASDSAFKLSARLLNTESSDDDNLFARTQLATYEALKSTLKDSNQRLRLCAGGKSFQQIIHRDAQESVETGNKMTPSPSVLAAAAARSLAEDKPAESLRASSGGSSRRQPTMAERLEAALSLSVDMDEVQDVQKPVLDDETKRTFATESTHGERGSSSEVVRKQPRPPTPAELEKEFVTLTSVFSQSRQGTAVAEI